MTNEIRVKVILHNEQAYPTVGNYTTQSDGSILFEISDTGDWFLNRLILIHELCEQSLCAKMGVSEQSITDFDLYYEKRREQGLVQEGSEPGFDSNAPYRQMHLIATAIEMQLAAYAGIDWLDYDEKINSM